MPFFVAIGAFVCGCVGAISGICAILNRGDYVGGGPCLIAGAIGFGSLAVALSRGQK